MGTEGKIPICSVIYVRAEGQERFPDGRIKNFPMFRNSDSFSVEFDNEDQAKDFNKEFTKGLREYGKNIAARIRSINISTGQTGSESC